MLKRLSEFLQARGIVLLLAVIALFVVIFGVWVSNANAATTDCMTRYEENISQTATNPVWMTRPDNGKLVRVVDYQAEVDAKAKAEEEARQAEENRKAEAARIQYQSNIETVAVPLNDGEQGSLRELRNNGTIESLCNQYGMSLKWFDIIATVESDYGVANGSFVRNYNAWGYGGSGFFTSRGCSNWYESSALFIQSFSSKYGSSPSQAGMLRYCPSGAYNKYF